MKQFTADVETSGTMMIERQSQRSASPTGAALHHSGEEISMETIYIYSNETGLQIAHHTAESNEACERWANEQYGSNDYHWSYAEADISNAI